MSWLVQLICIQMCDAFKFAKFFSLFFPPQLLPVSHGFIPHYLLVQRFHLMVMFATNNCFLLSCWKLSYIREPIVLIKHNYSNGYLGNSVSHSAPHHTFRHSLIIRVEILLKVCSHWFYYLNIVPSGQSWKCQSLSELFTFFLSYLDCSNLTLFIKQLL